MVAIFTRRLSDDLTSLVKQIDETVAKNSDKKMAAFVIYLSDSPDDGETKLKALAEKEKIAKTPLTVFQTSEGPDSYKVSKDADITVMMWKGLKVKANHSFGKDTLSPADVKKIVADTVKILE